MGNCAEREKTFTYDGSSKFVPPVTGGTVVKVYDGDTVTVATRLPIVGDDTVYRFSVRLSGIDCPELRGPHTDDTEHEVAVVGRDILSDRILGKRVELENVSTEKYGRLLADVYAGGVNLNEWMLSMRLAVPYAGGHKECPASWSAYYERGVM